MKNYYEILEVSKNASQEEIKQKYRELAKKWHPDANGNSKESEEKFKAINEAYSHLSSPELRKEYDENLFYQKEAKAQNTNKHYYDPSWEYEEEPFYTYTYTYSTNTKDKKNRYENSALKEIVKGALQIAVGIILFPLSGFFPLIGLYIIFSGISNIRRGLSRLS